MVILNDAEQSLLFFDPDTEIDEALWFDSETSQRAALLVAGLHEASIDIAHSEDAPTSEVLQMDLRGTNAGAAKENASDTTEPSANRIFLAFSTPDQAMSWTAAIKRASFPSGPLWTSRPQHIEDYAMSTLPCLKVGAVWRAEGTKTSVMIDSLRLCSSASLVDAASAESSLLLLRLKIFGCTLSMDQVLTSGEPDPLEVENLKTTTLQELLSFVTSCEMTGRQIDEIALLDFVEMIALNVMRPLHVLGSGGQAIKSSSTGRSTNFRHSSSRNEGGDAGRSGDDDDPVWTHLALAYELFLKLLSSGVCELSAKKRCVREELCHEFVQLFRSPNQIERDYVKTIAHCMYSKLVSHRGTMRQAMAHALLDYVHVSRVHEGVAEMLEVFGSIASGFAMPVKEEHREMLLRSLLPLHSMPGSEAFHEQLSFVLMQYVTKDPDLVVPVVRALLKYWPHRNAAKQILFLGEIGELVAFVDPAHFVHLRGPLMTQLGACIGGRHFQVAEYSMGLLNNNSLYALIFDDPSSRRFAYPRLVRALCAASESWNASVRQIGSDILQFLRTLDFQLYLVASNGSRPATSHDQDAETNTDGDEEEEDEDENVFGDDDLEIDLFHVEDSNEDHLAARAEEQADEEEEEEEEEEDKNAEDDGRFATEVNFERAGHEKHLRTSSPQTDTDAVSDGESGEHSGTTISTNNNNANDDESDDDENNEMSFAGVGENIKHENEKESKSSDVYEKENASGPSNDHEDDEENGREEDDRTIESRTSADCRTHKNFDHLERVSP
ncbi:Serine/threonine-protein phosphatase 2A 56 kDa regulatory subunit alpha isoform [Hondaea fermentalgiana]|uniref:Serine/threonine-protein phosphatase 2A 56 kDa regulatory subunit alpha isoform n=1 Tax=Hondaea fermentalgiana TaxID=2315210 RepID=A0A2R5GLV1_9STRA|nr:Serine/threonine-protein phosphatase 2A 56 kDa regulatory subunit alpha isoform [Hondaea fermentalgiana]|eukprot:GBG29261.1 Serine/threonine-protein phosphatase 2A 56 kDa regulatory subunit alpha isoform [Hondaea fermentalgiana]